MCMLKVTSGLSFVRHSGKILEEYALWPQS